MRATKILLISYSLLFVSAIITAQNNGDWRNIENALSVIPDENYADQPYVVIADNGDWVCVLTTGPGTESQNGQHMVATISQDKGKSWTPLIDIESSDAPPSSWGIPYKTPYGRIYVFYTFNGDRIENFPDGKPLTRNHNTELGWYCFKYSDDNGRTWSERHRLPMRKTTVDYINPFKGEVQLFWGISKPFSQGNSMFFSFTKMAIHPQDMGEGFVYHSNNINQERDPQKIQWELLPEGNTGISSTPMGITQEEHNIVPLNNGGLYCMYRTSEGYPANAYSFDNGRTWSTPEYAKYADGRVIKTPRACPRVFKTSNGKYLLWFHNNNIKGYKGHRNPVWLSGGNEVNGKIQWSQPEVLLYADENTHGMSYPDMIEENGKVWITETQKTLARVHEIDYGLLEDLWNQGSEIKIKQEGILLEEENLPKNQVLNMPEIPDLKDGAFSLEMTLSLNELLPDSILLDNTNSAGKGIKVLMTPERTLSLMISDGERSAAIQTDPGAVKEGLNHIVFVVDGYAKLLTSVVNGVLCDGGRYRFQGWERFNPAISNVRGKDTFLTGTSYNGSIKKLRIYDNYLRTSEAISNYKAEMAALQNEFHARYPMIPFPREIRPSEGQFEVSRNTTLRLGSEDIKEVSEILMKAIENQYGIKIKYSPECKKGCIDFAFDQSISQPEAYMLAIDAEKVKLRFKTLKGAFYAVQTLKQLLPVPGNEVMDGTLSLPAAEIKDHPLLSYRGYMLDVSRHYFPVRFIKELIDAMAFYKLNTLHLHLTDDQGWRVEIKKYPRLHEVGAWRVETQVGHRTSKPLTFDGERHGGYYTQKELKELVEYAEERFISVIPEIDIPGHAQALLAAYPEYGCVEDTSYEVSTVWGVHDNILCPYEQTFAFLEDVFTEIMDIFPCKYIHIGGDEVRKRRWEESKFCQELIEKEKLEDEDGLQSYFIRRVEDFLNSHGKVIIGWDEILEGGLAPNATVMSWRGEEGGVKAAKKGHPVIMTPMRHMYLNFYNTTKKMELEPLANSLALPLRKVYDYHVFPDELSKSERNSIMGLQACLWTEYVKTEENAEALTFPRLVAVSENAWLPVGLKNYDSFYSRLKYNVGHLKSMNINYSRLFLNPENNSY